jgi:hypothetical protein
MKEGHETMMKGLKERRQGVEETIKGVREQVQQTQAEVTRLKGLMANNKRVIEETENAKGRMITQIRDLTVSYSSLVSSHLLKKQNDLTLVDISTEIDKLKSSRDSKDSEIS